MYPHNTGLTKSLKGKQFLSYNIYGDKINEKCHLQTSLKHEDIGRNDLNNLKLATSSDLRIPGF